jgi:hypothetical protein
MAEITDDIIDVIETEEPEFDELVLIKEPKACPVCAVAYEKGDCTRKGFLRQIFEIDTASFYQLENVIITHQCTICSALFGKENDR